MNKILITGISTFSFKVDLDDDQKFGSLQGYFRDVDRFEITFKHELEKALADNAFDWSKLAQESGLFKRENTCSDDEIRELIKSMVHTRLYPHKYYSAVRVQLFCEEIVRKLITLKSYDWTSSEEILEVMKKEEQWQDAHLFYLRKLYHYQRDNLEIRWLAYSPCYMPEFRLIARMA